MKPQFFKGVDPGHCSLLHLWAAAAGRVCVCVCLVCLVSVWCVLGSASECICQQVCECRCWPGVLPGAVWLMRAVSTAAAAAACGQSSFARGTSWRRMRAHACVREKACWLSAAARCHFECAWVCPETVVMRLNWNWSKLERGTSCQRLNSIV